MLFILNDRKVIKMTGIEVALGLGTEYESMSKESFQRKNSTFRGHPIVLKMDNGFIKTTKSVFLDGEEKIDLVENVVQVNGLVKDTMMNV